MAWYEVVFLIFVFGGLSALAFYSDIKRVREYTRTERLKREFMEFAGYRLQEISVSLQMIANKD